MARLSSIKCLSDISSQKTHELLVVGAFEGASVAISGKKDLSNFINDKIKLDDFSGKEGKMLSSYGIPDGDIKRWLLVGFGDKKNFSSDKLRAIAANIVSYANKNNLKSISLDAKSLGLSKSDYLQALCEGLVLGSYEFLNYKSKVENENSLKTERRLGAILRRFSVSKSATFSELHSTKSNYPAPRKSPAPRCTLASSSGAFSAFNSCLLLLLGPRLGVDLFGQFRKLAGVEDRFFTRLELRVVIFEQRKGNGR